MLQVVLLGVALAAGFGYLNVRRQRQAEGEPLGAVAKPRLATTAFAAGGTVAPGGAISLAPAVGAGAPGVRLALPGIEELGGWLRWQLWVLGSGRLPPLVAGLALLAGGALIFSGQSALAGPKAETGAFLTYALGLAVIGVLDWRARRDIPPGGMFAAQATVAAVDEHRSARLTRRQFVLLGVCLLASLYMWNQIRSRPPSGSFNDLFVVWAIMILTAVAAAVQWPLDLRGWRSRLARPAMPRREVWLLVGITAIAFLARGLALDRFPRIFGGDEGSMAMSAMQLLQGQNHDPFGTGWMGVPSLYHLLQGFSIRAFGDTVQGVRMLSALEGTAAVVFAYLLARRWFGLGVATLTGLLLAVFHYHLFSSRVAVISVTDSAITIPAIYLLDRALAENRRVLALLAGFLAGIGQYLYFGSRITIVILVLYAALAAITTADGPRLWARVTAARVRTCAQALLWTFAGAALMFLPLLAYYTVHPSGFTARASQVTMFTSGWLANEMKTRHQGALPIIYSQMQRAFLLPFHTPPSHLYYGGNDIPLLGIPMALLVAIGLVLTTTRILRRPYFALGLIYWGAVGALSLTDDPTQSQRMFSATPVMAVFAALALVALGRIVLHLVKARLVLVQGLLAAAVVFLAGWNINHYFFAPDHDLRFYGNDPNGLAATDIAYYLRSLDKPVTTYFLGPGRMYYYGFQTLPYIAPNSKGMDVEKPYTPGSAKPDLKGTTVFVALPERTAELNIVQGWVPNGAKHEVLEDGKVLFTSYEVG
jgi:hypothetical protein